MHGQTHRTAFGWLGVLAMLAVIASTCFAIRYGTQPTLDAHAFRQSQTALTAYWFAHEGFKLAYETPVGGVPWSIPFEFPIYQAIVAAIHLVTNAPLDQVGRLTSHAFLLLCILPAASITRKLALPRSVFLAFIAIFFSMPIYLYWGRSFMIETTALFFSLMTISSFLDYLRADRSIKTVCAFLLFASLTVLQKATTGLPVLLVLSVVFLVVQVRRSRHVSQAIFNIDTIRTGLLFAIPVLVGYVWLAYTDQVKSLNPLGQELTSAAISLWNWGTLQQRISPELWNKVLVERIFIKNLGALGLLALVAALFLADRRKTRPILLTTMALGILPLLLFPNLHIVHQYYQSANAVFFACGLAVALASISASFGKPLAALVLIGILSVNGFVFHTGYKHAMAEVFARDNNRDLAIGAILKRELPADHQFVAFGNDWSATFSYLSERKSFTVPEWFNDYARAVSSPELYVEKNRLGGIVACAARHPNLDDILDWATHARRWKVGETHGCLIATPEQEISDIRTTPMTCHGQIDKADITDTGNHHILSFSGWVTPAADNPPIPDAVFIRLSPRDAAPIYLQALSVPRADASRAPGMPPDIDIGFSRLYASNLPADHYQISLIQKFGDQYMTCNITTDMHVPSP